MCCCLLRRMVEWPFFPHILFRCSLTHYGYSTFSLFHRQFPFFTIFGNISSNNKHEHWHTHMYVKGTSSWQHHKNNFYASIRWCLYLSIEYILVRSYPNAYFIKHIFIFHIVHIYLWKFIEMQIRASNAIEQLA